MIQITKPNGVVIELETCNDPDEVDRLLSRAHLPEAYADLKARVVEAGEILFEFTAANRENLPSIRHFLVHLDRRPRGTVNLTTGDFILTFSVHEDNLGGRKGNSDGS
jgi:hypothetical protein